MSFLGEIEDLVSSYIKFLKEETTISSLTDNTIEITSPFLDRHNDYLQIYVKKESENYILTDDSYTISDLIMSGCELDTPKRKNLLQETLAGYGVDLVNESLQTRATSQDFHQKQHALIQAMLAVNDLFYLSQSSVKGLFLEDVMSWFDSHEVRAAKNIQLYGKSGFQHRLDYIIPKSNDQPERAVEAVSHPSKSTIGEVVFKFNDIRPMRGNDLTAIAILNDQDSSSKGMQNLTDALRNYNIEPIIWSKIDESENLLVA